MPHWGPPKLSVRRSDPSGEALVEEVGHAGRAGGAWGAATGEVGPYENDADAVSGESRGDGDLDLISEVVQPVAVEVSEAQGVEIGGADHVGVADLELVGEVELEAEDGAAAVRICRQVVRGDLGEEDTAVVAEAVVSVVDADGGGAALEDAGRGVGIGHEGDEADDELVEDDVGLDVAPVGDDDIGEHRVVGVVGEDGALDAAGEAAGVGAAGLPVGADDLGVGGGDEAGDRQQNARCQRRWT
jgi:hypothetical protein